MYAIELDIKITRRQRINTIRDGEGNLKFTSTTASPIFDWLWNNGVKAFRLDVADDDQVLNSYYLELSRLSTRDDPIAL